MKKVFSLEQKQRRAEYLKRWRSENPEKVKEQQRRTRANCAVSRVGSSARWRANNLEAARARGRAKTRAWQLANPAANRAQVKAWKAANRHKVVADNRRYVVNRRRGTPPWADKAEIAMFYEVAAVLSRGGVKFEVDHIEPVRGKHVCGLHVSANLQILPARLNRRKSNKPLATNELTC